ncbi:hypothetical protein OH76DRAFT_1222121 [Lentinus brumalis]|uniref:Uncharacterized protein n=1 Tax=Lentinus brumalis TaxID=2498619 RepID=A0A371DLQ5_9APHY|nr:hypothetical protein OH76DRAFT_1222121 [Polyporus brumalis]
MLGGATYRPPRQSTRVYDTFVSKRTSRRRTHPRIRRSRDHNTTWPSSSSSLEARSAPHVHSPLSVPMSLGGYSSFIVVLRVPVRQSLSSTNAMHAPAPSMSPLSRSSFQTATPRSLAPDERQTQPRHSHRRTTRHPNLHDHPPCIARKYAGTQDQTRARATTGGQGGA